MLEFQELTKSFSKKINPAISSAEFNVSNGETVGFVGLNGAGKTTTIRIAAGVALPTSGTVLELIRKLVNDISLVHMSLSPL
ncbi:MAG: ATP-binding cassette domain-containing protein [Nitrososphaerales archaeon]